MKATVTAAIMISALLVGAADVYALARGGAHSSSDSSSSLHAYSGAPNTAVPELFTLYAVGSAIALLGGAGWYIRRRK